MCKVFSRGSYRGFLQAVQKMVMLGLKSGVGLTYQSLAGRFWCLIGETENTAYQLTGAETNWEKRQDSKAWILTMV